MPPQVKVSKEQIKDMAFLMTKESGFESVTARKLADRLSCSTQPIFRVYENMDALKCDVYAMCTEYAREKMNKGINKKEPLYLSLGLNYIELARNEQHLFRLIAAVDDLGISGDGEFLLKGEVGDLSKMMPGSDAISEESRGVLFEAMWLIVHGIATLVVSGRIGLSDEEIRGLITKTYDGLLHELKGK